MGRQNIWVGIIVGLLLFAAGWYLLTPSGIRERNEHFAALHVADDVTNYATQKRVEDACRAMIASYESDRLIYEQYKDDGIQEHQSWAAQARIRANKTASEYNNFILKNHHVWGENVPLDIRTSLKII